MCIRIQSLSIKDEWERYRAWLSFSGRHIKSDLEMLESYFLREKGLIAANHMAYIE